MPYSIIKSHRCFQGQQLFCAHDSAVLDCTMRFAVYVPDHDTASVPMPVLWFLSGLTCSEENFVIKAGIQRWASAHKVVVVSPDTSPRGTNTIGEDDDYALGIGAGFYVNATQEPWAKHYRMHDYIVQELFALMQQQFPVDVAKQGITGFSMGGHGALIMGLRYPEQFQSVSAIAPIVAPSQCPWGLNAYNAYLGEKPDVWRAYDSCALIADGYVAKRIMVDQGSDDEFLDSQLQPDLLIQACQQANIPLDYTLHAGCDHSFYFVASVIEKHAEYHRKNW